MMLFNLLKVEKIVSYILIDDKIWYKNKRIKKNVKLYNTYINYYTWNTDTYINYYT